MNSFFPVTTQICKWRLQIRQSHGSIEGFFQSVPAELSLEMEHINFILLDFNRIEQYNVYLSL